MTPTILWIIAAICVIAGIVKIAQGDILLGIALILIGCAIGPGGNWAIFGRGQ